MATGIDDVHTQFRAWAEAQGIVIHKHIQAKSLSGKGIGIVAAKNIPVDKVIVKLPASTLVTIDSTFAKDERIPADLTVHCALATAWSLNSIAGESGNFREWEATWPSADDITSTVPLFWSRETCKLLPPAAQSKSTRGTVSAYYPNDQYIDYLDGVRRKYNKDWIAAEDAIIAAGIEEQTFRYYWMLVNSRCYFWNFAQSRKRKRGDEGPVSVDECMALCPFADYFNHGSHGCSFASSKAGCVITTNKAYEAGEEIILPYGTHNNDFLLIEYGFLLDGNAHDCIRLDALILPKLTKKAKALLEELNFLGEYNLYEDDTCFRTKVALAALFLKASDLRQYTETEDLTIQQLTQLFDQHGVLLRELQNLIKQKLKSIEALQADQTPQLAVMKRRWQEMRILVRDTKAWRSLDAS